MTDTTILEKKIGFSFKNKTLLIQALTHRSFLNENSKYKISNERLEFLGDSVLSLLTSTKLFSLFPSFPEGQLTNLRSTLVRAETLAQVAQNLDLGDFMLISVGEEKSGGRENESLLANLFEAILGAIFLDLGLEKAGQFLEKNLFIKIKSVAQSPVIYDFKIKLQELTQEKTQAYPVYKVISETGPDHNKIFTVEVYLQSKLLAQGSGKSKQEAQQDAAKIALNQFKM